MDMYNRYVMRKSGERGHQPISISESITFGILDFLKKEGSPPAGWDTKTEEEKNAFMERMREQIERSTER